MEFAVWYLLISLALLKIAMAGIGIGTIFATRDFLRDRKRRENIRR